MWGCGVNLIRVVVWVWGRLFWVGVLGVGRWVVWLGGRGVGGGRRRGGRWLVFNIEKKKKKEKKSL